MSAKSVVVLIFSCFAALAGGILAILLIRGLVFGRIANPWMAVGNLLIAALSVYFFYLGQRGLAYARGIPRPTARFGWGRMMLGALVLFGSAKEHFHPTPPNTPMTIRILEPANNTQAAAMHVTEVVVLLGSIVLMASGVWNGFRRKASQ